MTPILLIIIFHKIHGKDFLVEVADSLPLKSGAEQLSESFENDPKSWEGEDKEKDTFVEKLKKMESKSGNDYMSLAGRCEGDKKT